MHIANRYVVILWVFSWVIRIRGCVRRVRQPLLRGPEWFFNVHVQPDFYTGEGKKILHGYRLRMLIPFVLDMPITASIFIPEYLQYAPWLLIAQAIWIHVNHVYSVDKAEREARPIAVREAEQPVAEMALSLTPRRLRDYANPKVEWSLALVNVAALALLFRYYFADSQHQNWRVVFGVPAFYLYVQVGVAFVKRVVLAWRTPVPQTQAAEHMEVREETRKYYLKMCDWCRASAAAGMLFWSVVIGTSPAESDRFTRIWLVVWLVIGVVATVLVEMKRKQLVNVTLRARPVKMPDFLRQSEIAKWPVCYQPSAPMLILKGSRGYSLNLANTLAHLGAAYLAGMVVLVFFLRIGH
jgi:hypothetical protein